MLIDVCAKNPRNTLRTRIPAANTAAMQESEKPTRFRIRWRDGNIERQVVVAANRLTETVHCELPGGQGFTADVVAARATQMLLSHIVYSVLEPTGPLLWIEARQNGTWLDLREVG
jgi:hypothetical protein